MMHRYFTHLADGISGMIDAAPDAAHARKRFALGVARLGQRLYSGKGNIAWCGVTAPFDLLNAMGTTSCFVEFVGAMLANTRAADGFLNEAESGGYTTDSCAYHRAVVGAVMQGAMPVPDFIIGTSSPCTAGLAVLENFAKQCNKDFFVLTIPQNFSRASVQYLAARIEEMTAFVEDHTGRPLSGEALTRALTLTNKASALMEDIYSLAGRRPSPVTNRLLKDFGTVMPLLFGTEESITILEAFKKEMSAAVSDGSPDSSGEKIRLLWIQNRIQYPFPVNEMLENMGAKIVVDELNDVTWAPMDPDNPFESIAERMITIPYSMNISTRIEHLRKLAVAYRVDGAVNPCHWGCRQGTGARGLITRGLRQINVPVLNLEVDCVDSRNLAGGQVKTRLEAFCEMLG